MELAEHNWSILYSSQNAKIDCFGGQEIWVIMIFKKLAKRRTSHCSGPSTEAGIFHMFSTTTQILRDEVGSLYNLESLISSKKRRKPKDWLNLFLNAKEATVEASVDMCEYSSEGESLQVPRWPADQTPSIQWVYGLSTQVDSVIVIDKEGSLIDAHLPSKFYPKSTADWTRMIIYTYPIVKGKITPKMPRAK
ncbi:hypothetical protein SO802_022728 [Lithocarpus litseifolius]|uniref:Uncharacterized protein n=1 Tax=Lithocarpus litseifolius TaxID=425828 RepID=A0AAW2C7K4_9ROSI